MRIDINLVTHQLAMLNLTSFQDTVLPSVNSDITTPLTDSASLNPSNMTPFQQILGKTLAEDLTTELPTGTTDVESLTNELLIESSSPAEIPIPLTIEASAASSNPTINLLIATPPNILGSGQNRIDPLLLKTIEENVLQAAPFFDAALESSDAPLTTLMGDKLKAAFSTNSASNQYYTTFLQAQAYQSSSTLSINTSPYSALNQFTQLLTHDVTSEEIDISLVNFADNGKILPITPDSPSVAQGGLINQSMPSSSPASVLPIHPHIATEFGKPAWGNDFNQQITWLATQKHQVAELHLHPADLGPVEIILHISNDQSTQVSAQFTSPHLAVREAIESALPRLREMMAENGITLGNTTVGAETSQQHPNRQQHSIASGTNENNATETKIQGLTNGFDEHAFPKRQGIINTFA